MDYVQPLVLDQGTYFCKAGFAGDDAPRAVFPTIVGRPKTKGAIVGMGSKDSYVGDEAYSKRRILTLANPLSEGIITNWDDMEKIYHHTWYNELCVAPEEHPLLFTEKAWNSNADREKFTQIQFETFNTPAMYLACDATLSMLTTGEITGLTIGFGHEVTSVVPIYEGSPLRSSSTHFSVGGKHILAQLFKLMCETYSFHESEMAIVNDIKEKLGYIALDYQSELKRSSSEVEGVYELPSGQVICTYHERFKSPEVLFQPSLLGKEGNGLADAVYQSIQLTPMDEVPYQFPADNTSLFSQLPAELLHQISKSFPPPLKLRKALLSHIVLEGGTAVFKGMKERVTQELSAKGLEGVTVVASPEPRYSTWIGGSILASLSPFQTAWVTKAQYDEEGPRVVRTCFAY